MKIFLTGVSGFLGRHILRELQNRNIRTKVLMRNMGIKKKYDDKLIEVCLGDITDINTYKEYVKGCDVVIHTAALASFNVKNINDYYNVNYVATKNLFDIAKKSDIRRFIYISSRGTIGVEQNPADSNELTSRPDVNQLDDYMRSKLLSEEYILNNKQLSCLDVLILSPTALLGGNDIKPTPIGKIIKNLLDKKVRTYLHGGINVVDVDDAATAVVNAIDSKVDGGVYILGGYNISLYDLFKHVCRIAEIPNPRIRIPYKIAYTGAWVLSLVTKFTSKPALATPRKVYTLHNFHSYCSSDKAVNLLNMPITPLNITMEKAVNWFQEKRNEERNSIN